MLAHQVKARHILSVEQHKTGKRFGYRRSIRISKNKQFLKNSISKDFNTPSIKELIELLSRQASKQARDHPSEAKQAGDKISKQCLITKAPSKTHERLGLKYEPKIWQSSA